MLHPYNKWHLQLQPLQHMHLIIYFGKETEENYKVNSKFKQIKKIKQKTIFTVDIMVLLL